MEEFGKAVLLRNMPLARELLLDGMLVKERLLNGTALEDSLRRLPTKAEVGPSEVLQALSLEMWLQRWGSRGGHCVRVAS